LLRGERLVREARRTPTRPTRRTFGALSLVAALAALAWPADAPAARWVITGRGLGHGVGMSQYGAYGFARHGRGYREILGHYYRETHIGRSSGAIRVLLASRQSVAFRRATKACGRRLRRHRTYRFKRSGSDVILRRAGGGHGLANCGRAGAASSKGVIRIRGKGLYRGRLRAKASGDGLLVINRVGIDGYAKGVVANEMSLSWPKAALRAQAVVARSYALATRGGGAFDVYDDDRSQVYGGKSAETKPTNRAVRRTRREVVRYRRRVAATYYFSTSGGRTESVEFGFPGADPAPYLKSVRDPYDRVSPFHRWRVRYAQSEMESRLSDLFAGRLKKIEVLKRGDSPRIVRARVVGTSGSSRVSGLGLQIRLGLNSTWARFHKR
jgi:stage II sporulation protein D